MQFKAGQLGIKFKPFSKVHLLTSLSAKQLLVAAFIFLLVPDWVRLARWG